MWGLGLDQKPFRGARVAMISKFTASHRKLIIATAWVYLDGPEKPTKVCWDVVKSWLVLKNSAFADMPLKRLRRVWSSRGPRPLEPGPSPSPSLDQDTEGQASMTIYEASLRTSIIFAARDIAAPHASYSDIGCWEPHRGATDFRREPLTEDVEPGDAIVDAQQGTGRPTPCVTDYQYVEILGETTQHIAMRLADGITGNSSDGDVQSQLTQMESVFTDSVPHHYNMETGIWEPVPGATICRIPLVIQDSIPKRVSTRHRRRLCVAVAIFDVQFPPAMTTGFTYDRDALDHYANASGSSAMAKSDTGDDSASLSNTDAGDDQDYPSESSSGTESGFSTPPLGAADVQAPRVEEEDASATSLPPPPLPVMGPVQATAAILRRRISSADEKRVRDLYRRFCLELDVTPNIRGQRLCTRCLGPGHYAKTCDAKYLHEDANLRDVGSPPPEGNIPLQVKRAGNIPRQLQSRAAQDASDAGSPPPPEANNPPQVQQHAAVPEASDDGSSSPSPPEGDNTFEALLRDAAQVDDAAGYREDAERVSNQVPPVDRSPDQDDQDAQSDPVLPVAEVASDDCIPWGIVYRRAGNPERMREIMRRHVKSEFLFTDEDADAMFAAGMDNALALPLLGPVRFADLAEKAGFNAFKVQMLLQYRDAMEDVVGHKRPAGHAPDTNERALKRGRPSDDDC